MFFICLSVIGRARGGSVNAAENVSTVPDDSLAIFGPTGSVQIPIQWRVDHKSLSEAEIAQLAQEMRNVKMNYKEQLRNVLRQHK